MAKILRSFNLDFSDLPAAGGKRLLTIKGEEGAEFYLEITNEDNYYYNFTSDSFQVTKTVLEHEMVNKIYEKYINFPTITDNDQM